MEFKTCHVAIDDVLSKSFLQVFAGVYPVDGNEFKRVKFCRQGIKKPWVPRVDLSFNMQLEDSVSRLTLNDASVGVQRESSNALGQGFRLG